MVMENAFATAPTMTYSTWEVKSSKSVHYSVIESENLFDLNNPLMLSRGFNQETKQRRCLILIDENVWQLYAQKIVTYFDYHDVETKIVRITCQESDKTMENVFLISRAMHDFKLSRRGEPLIGIGGGVLLDMVGMAASIYRRGTPYLRVPTTLMGLIDAGIGVKTGVNFDYHKNRLGTYHAPLAAYLDRSFLKTLDDRHMSNGLAEILKIALVKDRTLFELMERNVENMIPARLQGRSNHDEIFCRAIQGMLEELEPNLWEDRLERLVDYGHSFSPSIEMKALPKLLHGEAVNIDMVFSLILSKQRGLLSQYDLERVLRVMRQLNLPISHELCTAEFMQEALDDTVKHRNGRQRLPLTIGIGECMFVNDVSREEIESAAIELHQLVAQV
jgi:3-dehydroquinate synthase